MELHFYGVGAAFNPAMGNNGAFFTRGGDLYLLDCGATAYQAVMRAGLFDRFTGSVTIIMTHLHADHCGSLGTLVAYAHDVLGRSVTIIHPDESVQALLAAQGVGPDSYTLQSDMAFEGLTVTPMTAQHVPSLRAYSYLLADEDGTIYYSGDNSELDASILDGLRTGRIQHAYVDVMWMTQAKPSVHLPYPTLVAMAEPALRGRITLMHYNTGFNFDQAKADGFLCAAIDPVFEEGTAC